MSKLVSSIPRWFLLPHLLHSIHVLSNDLWPKIASQINPFPLKLFLVSVFYHTKGTLEQLAYQIMSFIRTFLYMHIILFPMTASFCLCPSYCYLLFLSNRFLAYLFFSVYERKHILVFPHFLLISPLSTHIRENMFNGYLFHLT